MRFFLIKQVKLESQFGFSQAVRLIAREVLNTLLRAILRRIRMTNIDKKRLINFINSRTAIAGAIIGLLLVFYNSKNLNCIGALSFFLRSVHTFS